MKDYITVLGMAFAITLPHAALAQTVTPPAVPPGLEVPEGNHAFLLGHGVGTQNYVCAPTDKVGHVDWILFTPQATLFSDGQLQLTTHFFSPNPDEGGVVRVTWEDSTDTSTVWAKLITPSTDPNFVESELGRMVEASACREPGGPDRRQQARRDNVHSESEYRRRAGPRRLRRAARRRQEGIHSVQSGLHLLQEELNTAGALPG